MKQKRDVSDHASTVDRLVTVRSEVASGVHSLCQTWRILHVQLAAHLLIKLCLSELINLTEDGQQYGNSLASYIFHREERSGYTVTIELSPWPKLAVTNEIRTP